MHYFLQPKLYRNDISVQNSKTCKAIQKTQQNVERASPFLLVLINILVFNISFIVCMHQMVNEKTLSCYFTKKFNKFQFIRCYSEICYTYQLLWYLIHHTKTGKQFCLKSHLELLSKLICHWLFSFSVIAPRT